MSTAKSADAGQPLASSLSSETHESFDTDSAIPEGIPTSTIINTNALQTPPLIVDETSRPIAASISNGFPPASIGRSTSAVLVSQQSTSSVDITPTSLISPPVLHSRQSSTVAESFRTAQESPWQSQADLDCGEPDTAHDNHSRADGESNLSRDSAISSGSVATDAPSVPEARQHSKKLTQQAKGLAPLRLDSTQASNGSSRQPTTPITPTVVATPTIFASPKRTLTLISPRQRPRSSLNGAPESPGRRFSSVSSSNSTIIEAIVIDSPAQKPQRLRHVSKTPSLRTTIDSSGSRESTVGRRAISESAVPSRTNENGPISTKVNEAARVSIVSRTNRVVTEPATGYGTTRHNSNQLLSRDVERRPYSVRLLKHDLSAPMQPDITQPLMYTPLSALPQFKTWSQSLSNNAMYSAHHRSDSYASRDSGVSVTSGQSQAPSTRTTAHSTATTFTEPGSTSIPSLTNGSLVTVVRQPLFAEADDLAQSRKSLAAQRTDEFNDTKSIASPFLDVFPSARRPSAASRKSTTTSDHDTHVSLDRVTIRSDEHPKYLYSQSTPFSQMSYTPVQLSEATAVSIHPHHNHSLLVVDQSEPPSRPNRVPALGRDVRQAPVAPQISVEPSTPPNVSAALDAVDSPLRNPRAAPLPPRINVLPATPMRDEDDPLKTVPVTVTPRPNVMTRARRYSDTLLQPFLSRSGSNRRRHSSLPRSKDTGEKGHHLHPLWQPRDFWMNASDSESDWDDEESLDRLPPGGDTSEPPPPSKFMPRSLSRRLPNFRGTGGFLIGNSLNLERHGTNKRRHYIDPPKHFNGSHVSLRRDSADHQPNLPLAPAATSPLRTQASIASLRAQHSHLRRTRHRWRVLGMHVEYVGVGGLRERWRQQWRRRELRQAEKRRDEIRRSIGPKFLLDAGAAGATGVSVDVNARAATGATAGLGRGAAQRIK